MQENRKTGRRKTGEPALDIDPDAGPGEIPAEILAQEREEGEGDG